MAINVKGDLVLKVDCDQCSIYGGNGGRGGHGSIGNDGGRGGDGAKAISAKSICVSFGEGKSNDNLTISGGSGGAGGNAGAWFFGNPSAGFSGYGEVATNVEILYK